MRGEQSIAQVLAAHFPKERLKTRLIDLYAWSSDAGFYSLVPQAVVFPHGLHEIALLFRIAREHGTSVTFRTAGTSLSGQAVTEGILADLSRNWPRIEIEEEGAAVRVQPGVTGSDVNRMLKPYGRKIGPDPASIQSAMMGGILSNNSSGMCCGVTDNSYHTLRYLQFMLSDGSVWDTENRLHYGQFEKERPDLYEGIASLRRRILENKGLSARIREKYRIKNTVGYGLNAFLDFDHPLDILSHLLIGAEGTLGFIAGAVLRTIPDLPYKSTALLFFDSPAAACGAIPALKASRAAALEFMDRSALRSIEHLPAAPSFLKELPAGASCLLCEYQAGTEEELQDLLIVAWPVIEALPLVYRTPFTTETQTQAGYWKLRKGLYPSIAAVREKGTSVILEDIAVPVEKLAEAIEGLQQLLSRFGYRDAIVFGHAKEGNLHFLISQSVATQEDISVFGAFSDALAGLVTGEWGGSLKGEHGTGRQVAPYVEAEWGADAYGIMKELKQLVDPDNILNPGVLVNEDKDCHLRHLKPMPVVEAEVDKCVECGYCENRCPSRNYTLSPRQRIVLRRVMARLKAAGDLPQYDVIVKDYQHDGMDTCAVDGMCATDCPVNINTGELVKRLRRENHSVTANKWATKVARNFGTVEKGIRIMLRLGGGINYLLGRSTMFRLTGLIQKVAPSFPRWTHQLTGPIDLRSARPSHPDIIYFASCINRMMGRDVERADSIWEVLLRLTKKAGLAMMVPPDLEGVCCGQAFSSKGFVPAHIFTVNQTIEKLWEWTDGGRIPLFMDISSCTASLRSCRPQLSPANQDRLDRLRILDSLEFATDILLPRLRIEKKKPMAVFHPVCSLYKMGLYAKLSELASGTTEHPIIPVMAGCCGMAGDRGFYYPGLTMSACKVEAAEVKSKEAETREMKSGDMYIAGARTGLTGSRSESVKGNCGYYSTGKTCEMAISEAVGKNYRSIFYLLDEVSEERV